MSSAERRLLPQDVLAIIKRIGWAHLTRSIVPEQIRQAYRENLLSAGASEI